METYPRRQIHRKGSVPSSNHPLHVDEFSSKRRPPRSSVGSNTDFPTSQYELTYLYEEHEQIDYHLYINPHDLLAPYPCYQKTLRLRVADSAGKQISSLH